MASKGYGFIKFSESLGFKKLRSYNVFGGKGFEKLRFWKVFGGLGFKKLIAEAVASKN